ncbi:MAG: TlpA family protein disulfide reductase [Nitrospirae bacterium]|nr:TlpA family protein disulfide reductase [Nitrospirota bacterium]
MLKKVLILASLIGIVMFSGIVNAGVPMAGDKAPDFSLTSVKGEKVTLSQYKGSVVVLGLFHICDPCMNQASEMQKLMNEGTTKAVYLGVNTAGDTKEDVLAYLKNFKTKITFPYMIDPAQTVNKMYTQRFMPTVLIIDGEGVIRYRGSTTPKDGLLAEIKKIAGK